MPSGIPKRPGEHVNEGGHDLRADLWNAMGKHCFPKLGEYIGIGKLRVRSLLPVQRDLLNKLCMDFLHWPYDEVDVWDDVREGLKQYFFACEWREVVELVDFVAGVKMDQALLWQKSPTMNSFVQECNKVLKRHKSAYRFVGRHLSRATRKRKVPVVEEATEQTDGVQLMSSEERNTVFICYAHRNRKYLDELHEHLAPALRAGIIQVWDDTHLQGGEEWREEIKKALASAKVAICLVSSSFRASKFIAENELPPLLAAAKAEGVTILPVIVGHCDFTESELAGVQAVNAPSKPLDGMRPHQRNAIWVTVVRRVREVLTEAATASAAATPTGPQGSAVNRLGESLSPSELVTYGAQLNREQRYDEALRLLEPLTRSEPDNELAWLEYTYALAKTGNQADAVDAFARTYNLYQQREHPGISDLKFPQGLRYVVFAGTGSGTYNHGLTEKPDDIHTLGSQGNKQVVFDAIGSTTVHVTNMAAEPWVAVARQLNDTQKQ